MDKKVCILRENGSGEIQHAEILRRFAIGKAETIKTAILQGQYEAAKGVNRIQLAVYFGIGKFVSLNTRKGVWGIGGYQPYITKRTTWT